jgi:hypothetical protein
MKLVNALRTKDSITENGMATNSSSLSFCVDLFFNIGAMRGSEKEVLIQKFSLAYNEDPERAMKILFWARDVRGGAGERQIFRDIIIYLAEHQDLIVKSNLSLIPFYGRWDDVLVFEGTRVEKDAFSLITEALDNKDGLCAKWMPRKGKVAAKLRNFMKLSPKEYRKLLVSLTDVVESKMCSGDWDSIDFSKLPSLASARYQKAFTKNAPEQYAKYREALKNGTAKINAGAVYPYDITKSLGFGDSEVANQQWKSLPNYMEGANGMILPVVDVSGSMQCSAGNNKNLTCMDVAISLGLYISERNEGSFKDSFITFSANPDLQVLSGDLNDRFRQLSRSDWGMNTDLQAVFELILNQAVKNSVPAEEMPSTLLILSDMEFDQAVYKREEVFGWGEQGKNIWNPTAQEMIKKSYEEAGYEAPSIVYWNLNASGKNIPVSFDEAGTALVSGFSPAIMRSILNCDGMTPEKIMDQTIDSERYKQIKI